MERKTVRERKERNRERERRERERNRDRERGEIERESGRDFKGKEGEKAVRMGKSVG